MCTVNLIFSSILCSLPSSMLQRWGTRLRSTPGHRNLTTSSWHLKVSQVWISCQHNTTVAIWHLRWFSEHCHFASRATAQASVGGPDGGGGDEVEGPLRLLQRLPCCWSRLGQCLWHLSSQACTGGKICEIWDSSRFCNRNSVLQLNSPSRARWRRTQ